MGANGISDKVSENLIKKKRKRYREFQQEKYQQTIVNVLGRNHEENERS
jgi:hypothetical protein